jgi:flagellar motor switch protein FliN/FliY
MLTTQEALVSLGTATSAAAVGVLGEDANSGTVSVTLPGRDPLDAIEPPVVVATLPAADVTSHGSEVLVMPISVARRLAGVDDENDPDEAALGPLREPLNAALSAALAATGELLALDVAPGELELRVAHNAREAKLGYQGTTRAILAVVYLFGEACRLVQLVPSPLGDRLTETLGGDAAQDAGVRAALGSQLREVPLRVWAEVGRARLRTIEVAALTDGALVELDRAADDPVDLYVNGSRIATGRLVCIDGKEWAVELTDVFGAAEAPPDAA